MKVFREIFMSREEKSLRKKQQRMNNADPPPIATDVEPQVLLLDEIMAVGDEEFRSRCNQRIGEFRENGATVVLVSHGLDNVVKLCDRALLIDQGRVATVGGVKEVVAEYRKNFN